GGVTVDNSDAETHTTIYSISESPRDAQVIWAGTDDGNLQVTRDAGKTWTNVVSNVSGMPKASWVSWVEASRFDAATAYAAFDRHTFGDMAPHVFKTTDYGKTWTPVVAETSGVRGYAHVIKEDTVKPDLLFLGTEFGLWVSLDGGKQWAQYKGGNFPDVAVRDIVIHPRESDLVIATHGRGIWIVDDISPLRKLTAEMLTQDAVFIQGRATQQRLNASGGWAEGDAAYSGANPVDGAWITYYQAKRHIFGKMKIEVLDANGKVIDTVPANNRRGLTRVAWSMRLKGAQVPPAATAAFQAAFGPRVLPGTYTVRMTRGDQVYTTQLAIQLDPRATYTAEDRKLQMAAVERVKKVLKDMSFDVDQISGVRDELAQRASKLPASDPLRAQLTKLSGQADEIRRKIVATKEGGAVTGEERLREKTANLYGALQSYEGRPADYQEARIDSLAHELADVAASFNALAAKDLAEANTALAKKKMEPVKPITREEWEKANPE
ncbi:MAG TPA: hypothetical protein VFO34_08975, partial [Candidatus Acidoferrales bacterium]|nr:hypothetical protein [Candidatus Acidoferrales bacterium]